MEEEKVKSTNENEKDEEKIDDLAEDFDETKKSKKKRPFPLILLNYFPFLRFTHEKNFMHCEWCTKCDKKNNFNIHHKLTIY